MRLRKIAALAVVGLTTALAGCGGDAYLPTNAKHYVPLSSETLSLLSAKNMTKASPIMLRAYKKESELEVWKQTSGGRYALLKTYPMCRWSGQLGPKKREGDRQVPEGFYTINRSQLNPNSNYYLSFNIGYPNALDRSFGRNGAAIMVHGACTSMGCLSMTDEQMADIYALMREAFDGGQQTVQLQSMPFRMTAENLVRYRADDNIAFWRNLKEGADHFDVTKTPPKVAACGKRYVFNAEGEGKFSPSDACPPFTVDPTIANAVAAKNQQDLLKVASLIRAGERAVKRIYADGGQHESFKYGVSARNGRISQPDALAAGPRDISVDHAKQAKADAQFLAYANQASQTFVRSAAAPKQGKAAETAIAVPENASTATSATAPAALGTDPVIAAVPTVAEPQAEMAAGLAAEAPADATGTTADPAPRPRPRVLGTTPLPATLREPMPTSGPIDLTATQ